MAKLDSWFFGPSKFEPQIVFSMKFNSKLPFAPRSKIKRMNYSYSTFFSTQKGIKRKKTELKAAQLRTESLALKIKMFEIRNKNQLAKQMTYNNCVN